MKIFLDSFMRNLAIVLAAVGPVACGDNDDKNNPITTGPTTPPSIE